MVYDLIIIGGGPAGMAAALYAARQNLKFLFITENIGGMANNIPSIETYLGYLYMTGYELIEKFQKHLKKLKVNIVKDYATKIQRSKPNFIVSTMKKNYETKTIIICTGRKFKQLNIPGERKFKGKGLSECTACDGPLFKNKTVAVIGGGRTGIVSTLFLLKIAKKIYLIERSPEIKAQEGIRPYTEAIKKNKKVEIITKARLLEIRGDNFVDKIILRVKGKKIFLPVEGVFVEIGYEPNTDFVENFLETNVRREIIVDAEGKTNVRGIFAAGDVTHLREKQVLVAAGEGAKAALSAILYLEKNKK